MTFVVPIYKEEMHWAAKLCRHANMVIDKMYDRSSIIVEMVNICDTSYSSEI